MKYTLLHDNGSIETITTDNLQETAINLLESGCEAVIYEYADGLTYYREYGCIHDKKDDVYSANEHGLYSISPTRGVYDLQTQEYVVETTEE